MAQAFLRRGVGCSVLLASLAVAQSTSPNPSNSADAASNSPSAPASNTPISRQTRLELIRVFETQVVYAHVAFPMGTIGLKLHDGQVSPGPEELQQDMTIYGPSLKQGDPAQITQISFKHQTIRLDLNGGPIRKKKWYEHVTIEGTNSSVTPGSSNADANAHGTFVELNFDRFIPELTGAQLRDLLAPVLDFHARSKEQAYLDAVPPKVKEAIEQHHVLVGMDTDMVLHAKGKPVRKVRETEGDVSYEEWIYGEPPQDVDFVRIVGDEVVRVETMRIGGEKVIRAEKEIELAPKPKPADIEASEDKPAGAPPTLVRPGEEPPESVSGADTRSPMPASPPADPGPTIPPVGTNPPVGTPPMPPNYVARGFWMNPDSEIN